MKVRQISWRHNDTKEIELADALTPVASGERGVAENAEAQARKNAECIGRLVAALVESALFTIDQAQNICDEYGFDLIA